MKKLSAEAQDPELSGAFVLENTPPVPPAGQ